MRPFYVFDRWGKQVDTIAYPISARHKDTLNGEDSLTLNVIGTPLTKGQRIVWRDKFEIWHEHTVADTSTTHQDGKITETAYCESSISELLTDFLLEVEPKGVTSQGALEKALQNSRWIPGKVEPQGVNDFSWYHENAYEAVTDIVEKFGADLTVTIELGEGTVRARKINIVNHRGNDYGHLFTWGHNLQSVERSVSTDSIYTALYGWGKGIQKYDEETGEPTGGYTRKISFKDINDGQAWVGDDDARMRYGVPDGKGGVKHAFGQMDFDTEDPEELLELTKEALEQVSKPKVTYSGDVISLSLGGYANGEDAQPGDTVYIRDKELDERLQGRVLEVDRNILTYGSDTKITLGNIKSRFTQKLASEYADLKWLKDQASKWDEAALLPDAYLDAVINRLNILFNETGGFCYYEPGEGLITYDKPIDQNPTMAIQISGAGFRIANSKNPDGTWNWRTFGTGDGFTADELTTGIIKGGSNYWNLATGDLLFEQGIIRSADERNWWNFSTGEIQVTSGMKVGNLTLDEYVNNAADEAGNLALNEANKSREEAIKQLEADRLTQEAIFNTLTDGGSVQGIYLQNHRVYINSTYIGTGILQAGQIKDKKGLNFWDLETGEFSLTSGVKVGNVSLENYVTQAADDAGDEALKAANKAREDAIKKLESERLTQQAIFNTLTNGGSTQGIYLSNSRVYINASYIGTGTLQAGKIQDKNGNNYWDLETGEFRLTPNIKIGTSSSNQTLSSYIQANDSYRKATYSDVFNKLTSGGTQQGIYLSGGNIYINSTYIKTGTLQAGIIQDAIGSNYWNLSTGEFRLSSSVKVGSSQTALSTYIDNKIVAGNNDFVPKSSFSTYLKQKDVFNALTNNGQSKGIYLQNGLLYISGDYIRTGVIEGPSGNSSWDLSTGYFKTQNEQVAGGQSHTVYSQLYNGRLSFMMDKTYIGEVYIDTDNSDPNLHYFNVAAFTHLCLNAPGDIYVGQGGTQTSAAGSRAKTLRTGSVWYLDSISKSGTTLTATRWLLQISHGMIYNQVQMNSQTATVSNTHPPIVASVAKASELASGGMITYEPINTNTELNKAADEGRAMWYSADDSTFGELLYNGDEWASEPPDLGDPDEITLTTDAYTDTRADIIQSEIEALAQTIKSPALTAKISKARAALVAGDEVQMAKIAQDMSDTKPIISLEEVKRLNESI